MSVNHGFWKIFQMQADEELMDTYQGLKDYLKTFLKGR